MIKKLMLLNLTTKKIVLICIIFSIISSFLSFKIGDEFINLKKFNGEILLAVQLFLIVVALISSFITPIINGIIFLILNKIIEIFTKAKELSQIMLFKIYIKSIIPNIVDLLFKTIMIFVTNKLLIGATFSPFSYLSITKNSLIFSILSNYGVFQIISIYIFYKLVSLNSKGQNKYYKWIMVTIYAFIYTLQGLITFYSIK